MPKMEMRVRFAVFLAKCSHLLKTGSCKRFDKYDKQTLLVKAAGGPGVFWVWEKRGQQELGQRKWMILHNSCAPATKHGSIFLAEIGSHFGQNWVMFWVEIGSYFG